MILLDRYSLGARVAPAFVSLIPAILAVGATAPETLSLNWSGGATIVSIAASFFFAQFGRNFGKIKEPGLWAQWGGAPTTQLLRHRNTSINPLSRERYHKRLRQLRPDLPFPDAEAEAANPEKADTVYAELVRFLIERTRDTKRFPLVMKENINYGFLRNLWGLKPIGCSVALLSVAICAANVARVYLIGSVFPVVSALMLSAAVVSLGLWVFWVTPNNVRVAADAYAHRLLEASQDLPLPSKRSKTSS